MRRDFKVYLEDIYNACNAIERSIDGLTREDFLILDEKQAAAERRFEIMGEAITQCRIHYPVDVLQLGDTQGVVDFRNFLAHRYHGVDPDVVWTIIQKDMPLLSAKVKSLLGL